MEKSMLQMARRDWGEVDGAPVSLFELTGEGICAEVSNCGGVIRALALTDPLGRPMDVALGYDALEDYRRGAAFFGAMIGPIADRVADGRFVLDGSEVRLPRNAGPDSMHCGELGFHNVVWSWEWLKDGLRLFRTFDTSAFGFPGALSVDLRYRLPGPRTLRLEYAAHGTRMSAVSFTNHTYFNLNGARTDCRDHLLTVHADEYAETARMVEPICTGRTLPVAGTPLDLREGVRVGEVVDRTDFREIAAAGGIDHYFPVPGEGLREVARLRCPDSGLMLRCRSDAPGLLVYTGNGLASEPGKGGVVYGRNWGICLETARFPNAVNLPQWRRAVLLKPGESYDSATEFEFDWLTEL